MSLLANSTLIPSVNFSNEADLWEIGDVLRHEMDLEIPFVRRDQWLR